MYKHGLMAVQINSSYFSKWDENHKNVKTKKQKKKTLKIRGGGGVHGRYTLA